MVDLSYLKNISDHDDQFIIRMIQSFLDHAPLYLVEMKTACRQRNWASLALSAHKLKPSATYMGIDQLLEHIQQIEHEASGTYPSQEDLNNLVLKAEKICEQAYILLREELQ